MGRDPDYLAFMRAVEAALRQAAQGEQSVAQERAAQAAGLARVPRPPVAAREDITVPGGDGDLAARIYRASADPGPAPALVFFHGGGWYLGDLDAYDPIVAPLVVGSGVTFVSVDYRLAPEHPYPAAVRDSIAATAWIAGHAAELGLDPGRLGVAGDSAGANLAAVVALDARDRGGPPLALQVLVYGAYDLRATPPSVPDPDGLELVMPDRERTLRQYLAGADPTDPYLSPLLAPDLSGLPPAVVQAAEYDEGGPQSHAYADALRQAGVPVTLLPGAGLDHGFVGWGPFARRPAAATAELAAAVRAAMLAGDPVRTSAADSTVDPARGPSPR
jgi:acetyl esterase